ncbi:restriction endonuclease [Corynebacterium sp. A21]|uniref:restriction endonuclease n=1 Tax=Corynebacterium sp. A21 TaxID=3457318 RepID=UPI003FD5B84D
MTTGESAPSFTQQGMPTHHNLVVPIIRAVVDLGGSAQSREIVDHVLEHYPGAERLLQITYPNRPEAAVFPHRVAWGRSTAKLIGALEQPAPGMYLSTKLGEDLLEMTDQDALEKIRELNREYNRQQRQKKAQNTITPDAPDVDEAQPSAEVLAETEAEDDAAGSEWKAQLLERLHRLSPEGFEKFVLYLLRRYGLQLTHIGGSGDEGIDGIGTAPLSPVLSSRVAVQVKRYAPHGKPIGRETVALFQRDAQTQGAERAILVTLSRFTEPARKAANSASPTVDLISGDRLADLIRDDGQSGVRLQPTVNETWFDKFD